MFSAIALAFYIAAWTLLIQAFHKRSPVNAGLLKSLVAFALLSHGLSAYGQIVVPEGFRFDVFNMGSLFFWVINLLVLISSLRKPLHNLFVLLLPFTVITIAISLPQTSSITPRSHLETGVVVHIFLSILAYSAMTMAAVQALILAFQNYQLRHKHPTGWVRLLPPLQTMEALLFELLWAGQALLTLAIVSGIVYLDDIFAQHLAHKTAFSIIAWCVFTTLLWGHYRWGWRGNNAVRWTLFGFVPLAVAYFGSKMVLELILGS
jgi:ABC-type uncharacterized transport system permease subunit